MPPRFWDNPSQKKRCFDRARKLGLDYSLERIKLQLREYDREKHGYNPLPEAKTRFWDNQNQGRRAREYAERHGLDLSDPATREAVRERYRKRDRQRALEKRKPTGRNVGGRKTVHLIEQAKKNPQYFEPGDAPLTNKHWKGDYFSWYKEFILPFIDVPPGKKALPLGRCHARWAKDLESGNRIVHLDPRDHFKSSFLGVGYAIYNLCEQIRYPILIISLDKENAEEMATAIQRHLTENPRIVGFYGNIVDNKRQKRAHKFFTKYQQPGARFPALFCTSMDAKRVTGTHPLLCIIDDPQDQPLSKTLMRRARWIINKKVLPALGKRGKLVVVGTIKGYEPSNDIFLWLEKKATFRVFRYPAVDKLPASMSEGTMCVEKQPMPVGYSDRELEYVQFVDPTADALWWKDERGEIQVRVKNRAEYKTLYPWLYQIEDLVRIRLEMSSDGNDDDFFSEYMLYASDPKGKVLKWARVGYFPTDEFASVQDLITAMKKAGDHSAIMIDPGGDSGHGDAVVCIALFNRKFYVIDCEVLRGGEHALAKLLFDWVPMYNVGRVGIESNYLQKKMGSLHDAIWYQYCVEKGKKYIHQKIEYKPSTGDKIVRIRRGVQRRLGSEGMEKTFIVNTRARKFYQFKREFTRFPRLQDAIRNEFDLLDMMVQADTHFVRDGRRARAAAV